MDNIRFISSEPAFWSRIGFAKDPTQYNADGNIEFYDTDIKDYIDEHKAFYDCGIKLHTTILHNGWVGVNKYDFSAVDKTLDAIFSINKNVKYLPRIKLNPPIEWCINNPTEIALNKDAGRNADEITALIKKLTPYYNTNGIDPNAPGDEGYAYLFSFCSKKWLDDATSALEKLIVHLENSKYADNIIGYQFGIGMCGENAYWGAWSSREMWGDYGITAAKCFENFCLEKYKTIDGIKKAYNLNTVSCPQDIIPSPQKRSHLPESLEDFFRKDNVQCIDYAEFINKCTTEAICNIAAVFKKLTKQKPVGTFYGYIYTAYPSESGHLGIERIINCKDIDFIASPKGYYKCNPGGPGGTQASAMSAGRVKIWFDELDNGTHIGESCHNPDNIPKSMLDTRTVYWREIAKNLSWNNLNFWIMDLKGGWFSDSDVMDELKRIIEFNGKMRLKERKSISEILFVTDEKSNLYCNCDSKLNGSHSKGLLNEITTELLSCGAPVDCYRLSDLKKIDTAQYKLIVFSNTYCINDNDARLIKNLLKNKLCVFNYTPGIYSTSFNIENVKKITGIDIERYNASWDVSDGYNCGVKLPPVKIKASDDLTILEYYNDGEIKTAKQNNAVLCTAPHFNSLDFHNFAKAANCHMYAKAGTTVYADSRFCGIFPSKDIDEINLPADGTYKDVISGNIYNNKNIKSLLKARDAMILIAEDK